MKRIYSLFLVMLLCLVGTVANAAVYPSSLQAKGGGITGGKANAVPGYAGKVVGSNVYYIPVGRVFIKSNAAPRFTGDGDMYITSLVNVMGLGEGATSYWSVWDITFNEDDQTVYIQNVGNRDIMTPLQTYSKTATRDAGYLYYTNQSPVGYAVGNTTNDSYKRFTWEIIASNGMYKLGPKGKETVLMYLCAQGNQRGSNEWGNNNYGDHVVKSGLRTNTYYSDGNTYRQAQWDIIPLTPEVESKMFRRNVQELNGYVGGVVTLKNVDKVEELQGINDDTDAGCEAIEAGAEDGATKMKEILDRMNEATEYVQQLIPSRPFFLENLCTYRPSLYSHLFRNGTTSWITSSNKVDVETTPQAVFYVEQNGTSNGQIKYVIRDANNYYISSATSPAPTTGNSKLNFVIDPVIPGIWQIRDVNNSSNPYLTINDNNRLTHYNVSEVSTLWKFQSYTTMEYGLQADPEATGNKVTGYTTYGQFLDSKLPAGVGVKAWTASSLIWDNNEMLITMHELTPSKDSQGYNMYWLKGGSGYLFTKDGTSQTDAAKVNENQKARFIPAVDYDSGLAVFEDGVNYFRPVLNEVEITEENWKQYFYLSYAKTGVAYSQYKGEPVNGYGVGFYRLKPGKTVSQGKARIAYSDVFDDDSKRVPRKDWNTNGVKGQMLFIDSEGETTDVLTITADGNLIREENTYFDLSGRRVAQPSKGGIYIKNGKKVLY